MNNKKNIVFINHLDPVESIQILKLIATEITVKKRKKRLFENMKKISKRGRL